MTQPENKKLIAIFYTDHENKWSHPHGTFVTMVKDLLDQVGAAEYRVFDIYGGDIPKPSDLLRARGYAGIFITGSRYDSYDDNTEWVVKLRQLLGEILSCEDDSMYPPVVGFCFGHQVVARSLGAKVGRNPNGFEGGVTVVDLNEEGERLFDGRKSLNLSELHNDTVLDLPEGYVNWGSTSKSSIQGLYKPGRVLTFQGHPEFTSVVVGKGVTHMVDDKLCDVPEDELELIRERTTQLNNDGVYAASVAWKLISGEI